MRVAKRAIVPKGWGQQSLRGAAYRLAEEVLHRKVEWRQVKVGRGGVRWVERVASKPSFSLGCMSINARSALYTWEMGTRPVLLALLNNHARRAICGRVV